jgi:hypothetical protein
MKQPITLQRKQPTFFADLTSKQSSTTHSLLLPIRLLMYIQPDYG